MLIITFGNQKRNTKKSVVLYVNIINTTQITDNSYNTHTILSKIAQVRRYFHKLPYRKMVRYVY